MPYKFKYGNNQIEVPKNSEFTSHSHSWSAITGKPSSLPANGGDADTVDGIHSSGFMGRGAWWNNGSGQNVNNIVNDINFVYTNHGAPTTGTIATFSCVNANYQLQIMSSYNGYQFWYRNKNGDNGTWTSWTRLANSDEIADSGWVDCTLGYGISQYGGGRAAAQVRRIGKVVHLRGCVKNSTTWTEHDSIITIPSGYRPSQEETYIMQGSGSNRFCLLIKPSGVCNAQRYSNNTTMSNTVPVGTWLNLCATWFID